MTSIPVGNVVNNAQKVSTAKGAFDSLNVSKQGNFQDAMDLITKTDEQTSVKQPAEVQSQSPHSAKEMNDGGAGKQRVADMQTKESRPEEKLSEDDLEKVEATGQEIIKMIADELEVDPEDVENAMQMLGIGILDLANPNQMSALMTELMELPDSIQIVTDSDLFESFTQLSQSVDISLEELAQELGVSTQELGSLLQEQISVDPENLMDQPTQEALETLEAVVAPSEDVVDEAEEAFPVLQEEDVADVKPQEDYDNAAETDEQPAVERVNHNQRSVANEVLRESIQPASGGNGDNQTQDRKSETQNHREMYHNVTSYSQNNNLEQVTANQEVSETFTERAEIDDIMRQIGDYVRTNVTPDIKQMEIQLTPANLGQVHINLMSRNGVVTAQITTETEIVRQALEIQAVQLKERLESQGVKIEAVEVTVESHEFERNLDENEQNRQSGEQQKKASTRRWNLSDMDDELLGDEALTDAEQVELDMMKLRGGNLNYMV